MSMETWWNDTDRSKIIGTETCHSAILSDPNHTCTDRDRTGVYTVRGRRLGRNGWITLR